VSPAYLDNLGLDYILPISRGGDYFLTKLAGVLLSGRCEDAAPSS
jgi:hypothetical protein